MISAGFVEENSTALIGLLGVIVGAVLAALATLVTQAQQHKWAVEGQRREWRRHRIQGQLDAILAWQTQWLRTASGVRHLEDELQAAKDRKSRSPDLDIRSTKDDLQRQVRQLRDLAAPALPLIHAINDADLLRIHGEFMAVTSRYESILKNRDFGSTIESNRAVVDEVTAIVAQTHQRCDRLLDDV
jgi:hypothetical protein